MVLRGIVVFWWWPPSLPPSLQPHLWLARSSWMRVAEWRARDGQGGPFAMADSLCFCCLARNPRVCMGGSGVFGGGRHGRCAAAADTPRTTLGFGQRVWGPPSSRWETACDMCRLLGALQGVGVLVWGFGGGIGPRTATGCNQPLKPPRPRIEASGGSHAGKCLDTWQGPQTYKRTAEANKTGDGFILSEGVPELERHIFVLCFSRSVLGTWMVPST